MEAYKKEFIEFMLSCDVLKFGDFTLKSGRKSPFFMNAGLYVTGRQLTELAHYYALKTNDGFLAGYAGCWHILEEAHITTIAIHPDYRKKNFGQALLTRIIDDCYKDLIKYITLEVRVSNTPAINLYTKYGFSSFGTRKGYYQDNNEDALIMWTKNIFFDEFKNGYEQTKTVLKEQITINE